jgi:Iap family predicted aminopeptidase
MRNSYRQVYSPGTTSCLRENVNRQMEERASYPTERVRSLLQLFETRRLNALELSSNDLRYLRWGVWRYHVWLAWRRLEQSGYYPLLPAAPGWNSR